MRVVELESGGEWRRVEESGGVVDSLVTLRLKCQGWGSPVEKDQDGDDMTGQAGVTTFPPLTSPHPPTPCHLVESPGG